ncbi:Ig-like domain-containing protein [Sediminibacterium sp. C3]|uniref:Ig-like domain-containing protein n=1 Tax=Sediminibacterium sp. C3 TaxID=1267211 RepID=UPI0013786E30|nr:Ig-like domain-containing protein [Sediminibacterium sp. C3]
MNHRIPWFVLIISFFFTSCANIIPPSGGDRDSLPPVLVTALPKDSALNVSPKLITLTFDEFVSLQDVNSNLIVSPTLKENPIVDNKLKNLTIKFKDSLEANTTYSLNFGNAIKDVNEGNILKNFRFVFSTGSTIDNFSYRGKVLLAEKGSIDSTLIVILHNNTSDTAIYKNRPRYFTRINGKGVFEFNNLSGGYYTAYVLPNDFSKKYDDSTKLFAFRSEPLLISSNTITDTFYVFEAYKRKATQTAAATTPASKTDSRLKFTNNLDNGNQDLLSPLELKFSKPIKKIDSSKLVFTDSGFNPVKPLKISLDSTKTILSLHFPWKEQTKFNLVLLKDALEDTAGAGLIKSDTLKFTTKKEIEYGSIRLRFMNINLQKNPILQFFQADKLIESTPLTSNELIRKLFKSGSFEMRILYDTNKNGVWDTGAFGKVKRQPEVVQLISKPLSVRANWDNEVNIEL